MALPSKNLPFEYTARWSMLAKQIPGFDDPELIKLLEDRDRALEDFLTIFECDCIDG